VCNVCDLSLSRPGYVVALYRSRVSAIDDQLASKARGLDEYAEGIHGFLVPGYGCIFLLSVF